MAEVTPAKRKKGELACDPCRQLKVKCIREPGDDICKKCRRHNVTCVWSEIKVRTKTPRSKSAARIQALESKIGYVDSFIVVYSRATNIFIVGQPDLWFCSRDACCRSRMHSTFAVTFAVLLTANDLLDQLLSVVENGKSSTSTSPKSEPSPAWSDQSTGSSFSGMLYQEYGLTNDMANHYLNRYRSMSLYFPFVIIPSSMSMLQLACSKPMLCLAILTACSMQDRDLQMKLEVLLRRELAERIMVHQEKNLELLSALLVYLGWAHFYNVPKQSSTAQLIGLAVTICEDLCLGLPKEEIVKRRYQYRLDPQGDDAQNFSTEAKRLYMGTYFLVNSYSWAFAESSKVEGWEGVVESAQALAMSNEFPTDSLISCLVRMQNLGSKSHNLFADFAMADTLDYLQLSAQLDYVEEAMMHIRNELPPVLRDSGTYNNIKSHLTCSSPTTPQPSSN